MDDENARGNASIRDMGRHIVNACIQWARVMGYSDSTGFLRGLTVLAKEPVSLDELAKETGYSKSTVSLNMNLLEDLRLVRRVVIPGDKRHLYAPIIDPETIMTNMLETINKEVQLFCEALEKTENELTAGGDEVKYLRERVATLKHSYEKGKEKIDLLSEQSLNEMHKGVGVDSKKPHLKELPKYRQKACKTLFV